MALNYSKDLDTYRGTRSNLFSLKASQHNFANKPPVQEPGKAVPVSVALAKVKNDILKAGDESATIAIVKAALTHFADDPQATASLAYTAMQASAGTKRGVVSTLFDPKMIASLPNEVRDIRGADLTHVSQATLDKIPFGLLLNDNVQVTGDLSGNHNARQNVATETSAQLSRLGADTGFQWAPKLDVTQKGYIKNPEIAATDVPKIGGLAGENHDVKQNHTVRGPKVELLTPFNMAPLPA